MSLSDYYLLINIRTVAETEINNPVQMVEFAIPNSTYVTLELCACET